MIDIPDVSWREVLDIALVAFLYYRLILLIKGTRAVPVMYGLVLLFVLYYLSDALGLYTLNWLLANFLGSIVLVIIILFQQDIRRALAEVGAGRIWRRDVPEEEVLVELENALYAMAKVRVGALIVLERGVPLGEVTDSGVKVQANVTRELLMTLFYPGTPLHDGAVVVKRSRILAAGCILPLTPATDLSTMYGTRHRAAIGITEDTDAVALVVSEERGVVSMAHGGRLVGGIERDSFRHLLHRTLSGAGA